MGIDDLLDEYKSWKSTNKNFTAFDYLGIKNTYEDIIILSRLFLPDVSIIAGCFLLNDSRQKVAFNEYWKKATTAADLEKVINFICFPNIIKTQTEKDLLLNKELIPIVKQSWEGYFYRKYEILNLTVESYEDEYDGLSITVFQKENTKKVKPDISELKEYLAT